MKVIPAVYTFHSIQETFAFAADFAATLKPGVILALHGDLGAGKTTFVQALGRALGVTRSITSPTFTLVNEYTLPDGSSLVHMDLYRLADPDGLYDIGFQEYLEARVPIVIEWPERAGDLIPRAQTLHLHFAQGETETERILTILAQEINGL